MQVQWEDAWVLEPSGRLGGEKTLFPLPGIDPLFLSRSASSIVTRLTEKLKTVSKLGHVPESVMC